MTLPKIGKPATYALSSQGIYTLEAVSQYTKSFLVKMHGVGSKAISIPEQALFQHQLHFKTEVQSSLPFKSTGDVSCNHAPRHQQTIDSIVVITALDIELLRSLATTEFIWSVPGRFDIHGPQILTQELSNHYNQVASLNIHPSITYECLGPIHGIEILKTGKETHLAHLFEFENHKKGAKLSKATFYIVVG